MGRTAPHPSFSAVGLILAALLPVACSGDSAGVTPPEDESPPPAVVEDTFPRLSAAATAQALSNPATAERGVWSILTNLGIGVYAGDGTPIFAGSERSAEDFWVYDFEIPLMAGMPGEEGRTFEDYHRGLASVGLELSSEQLLAIYRNAYAGEPDEFLVALLAETGLLLDGSPEQITLDPLQEWLLLVDGFVPPNPPAPSSAVAAAGLPAAAGFETATDFEAARGLGATPPPPSFDTTGCEGFGGPHDPGWGLAGGDPGNPGLSNLPPALLTGLLTLAQSLRVEVVLSSGVGHHRHPDGNDGMDPDSVVFEAIAEFQVPPIAVLPCRPDLWTNVSLVTEPGQLWGIPDVDVEWELSEDVFHRHGGLTTGDGRPWSSGIPTPTDQTGRSRLVFAAVEEVGRGLGPLEIEPEPAMVAASFDLYRAALSALLPEPAALGYMPLQHTSPPQVVRIEWHEGIKLSFWAGRDPDQFGPILGALAGGISAPQGGPPFRVQNSPAGLETLSANACGLFPPGLHLGGTQEFLADGSASGHTATMRTRTELAEDSTEVAIHFDGTAAAAAVEFFGSYAEAATEELSRNWEWPALLVLDIENPEMDSLEVVFRWEVTGFLSGEPDYAQWWGDAHYRVRSCETPDEDWRVMFGIDDDQPEPAADSLAVPIQEAHIQIHLLLSAGALANAYLPNDEPPVESAGDVLGVVRAVVGPARDDLTAGLVAPPVTAAELRPRVRVGGLGEGPLRSPIRRRR